MKFISFPIKDTRRKFRCSEPPYVVNKGFMADFDPFLEVGSQRVAAGVESIVVVRPLSTLAFFLRVRLKHRGARLGAFVRGHRRNALLGPYECPLVDHMVAARSVVVSEFSKIHEDSKSDESGTC